MHLGERYYSDAELAEVPFRRIGKNVKIKRNAGLFFTENISIDDNTRIDDFTIIVASREPIILGRNAHIAAHCYISGSDGFTMEDFTGMSPGVLVFTSSDDYTGKKMTNPTLPPHLIGGPCGPVTLKRHAIIGAGSIILPNVTIGTGASVGSLSLVNKSLDEWGIYCGSPVRRIGDRAKDLLRLESEYLSNQMAD
jgi:acetyltransferase-like isoleucine patch superfamily enzyme